MLFRLGPFSEAIAPFEESLRLNSRYQNERVEHVKIGLRVGGLSETSTPVATARITLGNANRREGLSRNPQDLRAQVAAAGVDARSTPGHPTTEHRIERLVRILPFR